MIEEPASVGKEQDSDLCKCGHPRKAHRKGLNNVECRAEIYKYGEQSRGDVQAQIKYTYPCPCWIFQLPVPIPNAQTTFQYSNTSNLTTITNISQDITNSDG